MGGIAEATALLNELLQGELSDGQKDKVKKVISLLEAQAAEPVVEKEVVKAMTMAPFMKEAGGEDKKDGLQDLKDGFKHFIANYYTKAPKFFDELKYSQHPKVMVVACCDSRVAPATILEMEPGSAFVFRNIANLVPPWEKQKGNQHGTSAALEYAVKHLKVEHIIILGHRHCGGIKALVSRDTSTPTEKLSDFIDDWMEIALPARAKILAEHPDISYEEKCLLCEKESVNVSLLNLLTFPWVKDAVAAGSLRLHGWHYDFVQGNMDTWELQLGLTRPVQIS